MVPELDALTPQVFSQPSPSLSSAGTRTDRQTAKRRAASEWISMALDEKIPYETDAAFRSALADGVVLCRLVNWVRPGTIPKVRDLIWCINSYLLIKACLVDCTDE